MTRTIPVDIEGLNLILGGGIPVLKRHETYEESATLLVRGPPGSGKTIFGVQLAGSLARSLGCDVVYGCVELLPTELAAQHAGIKRPEVKERVVPAPYPAQEPKGDECRIFAEMLDIGSSGEEVSKLGDAVESVVTAAEQVGGNPRVLVIDSLSDGYRLGASAPRELADALCKMAARKGMILILLEETVDAKPSAWSFAVDVVLQVGPSDDAPAPGSSDAFERRVNISKNRFGPSEPGIHRFRIAPQFGVNVLPHPRAYTSSWAPEVVFPRWDKDHRPTQTWGALQLSESWPQFTTCVTVVYGNHSANVRALAYALGASARDKRGADFVLGLSRADGREDTTDAMRGYVLYAGSTTPYQSGNVLMAMITERINALRSEQGWLRRVVIGDLQALRSFWGPDQIRHALGSLAFLLRRVGIPMVLFETAPQVTPPPMADFADVVIRVMDGRPFDAVAFHPRSGRTEQSQVKLPPP